MGSFSPLLDRARAGEVGMGPYAIATMFALGVFFTTPVFNVFFMNLPVEGDPVDFANYFASKPRQHLMGIIGGAIWCTGMLAGMVSASAPEQIQSAPLPRFLLAQCWPLLAALWGMLVFHEFKDADVRVKIMGVLMLVLFLCGLAMIGMAPLYVIVKS